MAGPNVPSKPIETVQIIHAEVDLESVIRKLAIALETHLKLPGKADFDTDKEYKASHIIDQLKGVIDQRTYSVFYITDALLKLFKEDRKLQGTLKDLLKKNAKLGGGSGKPIAILWAVISDINLVKATLNIKYKNLSESFAHGVSMGAFAPTDMGNLVEAVQKIWLGDAATLPSAFPDPEPVDVPHRSSSCTDIGKDLGVVNELPFPGLSIVYFGTGQLEIVTQLATRLMIYMREEASPHYFTFFKSGKDDSVKKVMMQMKGLSSGHFRVVLILSKELLELLKESGELDEFGRICARTSGMKPPQVTFLTERILLEDVQGYSRSLGVTITERCFLDIDPEKLDELAFNLKQIFDDGRRAEPVEDEDLSWRETKKEHINDKRRVVISSGESLVMPDDFNATGPSLTSVINRQLTDPRPIDAIDDGDSPRSVPAGHFSVGDSACGATDMEQRSDTFSRYYEKQEKTTKTDPCPSDGGKAHSENGCTVALPKIENSHDNFSLDSPGSAKGVADKPHSLKSKSNSVSFADSRTLHQLPTKQQESISGKGGPLHSKETATSSNAPPNYDGDAMAIKPNQVPPHTHGFHQNHQGAHKHPPMDHLQGRHEVQPNHRPHSNPPVGEFMSLFAQSPEFRSQVLTFLNHPGVQHGNPPAMTQPVHPASTFDVNGGMYPMSQFQMAHQQHPGSSYPGQQPASTSNYAQRGTYAASQQQHQQQPLNAVHPASTIQSGPSTFMHHPLPQQQQQQPQGFLPTQPSPIPSNAARPRLMTSQSVPELGHIPSDQSSSMQLTKLSPQQPGNIPVVNLPAMVKKEIGILLNADVMSSYNWIHFAEQIGVRMEVRNVWKRFNDPMENLYDWIKIHKEEFAVSEFKSIAAEFERRDVVRFLEKHGF
ncbi:uncharacterized protein [Apostichopus japonicus]|uniref:uncharacterized protein isoform X3 n=1 Tax=Stichopus japonicus TaxID=307972 RepID=UPI003AB56D74